MSIPAWARDAFSRVIVIDTETGGLDPSVNAVLGVAAVTLDCTMSIDLAINDPGLVEAEALQVNGIDLKSHRETALAPVDAAWQLSDFVGRVQHAHPGQNLYAAGRNVAFRLGFIRRLYSMPGSTIVPMPRLFDPHQTIDTHAMLWMLHMRGRIPFEATSSEGAFKHFGIDVEGRHTARGDAIATARLVEKILSMDF